MMKDLLPPRARGYIIDQRSTARIEITDDIMNWNDLAIKHQRKDFSGVFTTVSQPLELCRRAKTIVRETFRQSMLSMRMMFEVIRRGPKDYVYQKVHSMLLDAGSYEEHKEYLTIEGQALTFDSLVKSVGKTKYDLPIKDKDGNSLLPTVDWVYLHNQMLALGSWVMPEESVIEFSGTSMTGMQPIVSLSAIRNEKEISMPFNGIPNDFKAQEYKTVSINTATSETGRPDTYFFMSKVDNQTVRLIIDFVATCTGGSGSNVFIVAVDLLDSNNNFLRNVDAKAFSDNGTSQIIYQINEDVSGLNDGDRLQLNIRSLAPSSYQFLIDKFNEFSVKYIDKSNRTDTIPAITPLTLANTLLDKMAGGDTLKKYTAVIDADTDNPWAFDHYLVAAESIRGFETANFHASFNDFLEYMQFLGYEYETDEDARMVYFRKRAKFFNRDITAMNLREGEVANVVIKADDEYAYSTVRVGYEKPDIENTNGRFAMCGAFDYSTDYSNSGILKDSTLEIMSPYKADPVLLETLSWTRGEKTTDQKDDNDIFMLAAETVGDHIEESRAGQYMVTDEDLNASIGWYNVPYIPYFIAQRNAGKIGVAVKNLKFASTETYREATLSGAVTVDPYSNIAIPEGHFLPMKYEFDTGTHKSLPLAELRSGLVKFMWNGQQYQGYIEELVEHAINTKEEAWVLRAR